MSNLTTSEQCEIGSLLTVDPEQAEQLDLDYAHWSTINLTEQLAVCLEQGGGYSVADAIHHIELYDVGLKTTAEDRERLIELLHQLEGSAVDQFQRCTMDHSTSVFARHIVTIKLLSELIYIALRENEDRKPNIELATHLFEATNFLVNSARSQIHPKSPLICNGILQKDTADYIRQRLMAIPIGVSGVDWVNELFASIRIIQGSQYLDDIRFKRYFIKKGYALAR